jgi:uncharacterized protein YggU (UPF0235/DUF167 family)
MLISFNLTHFKEILELLKDVQADSVGVRISAPPVDGEANKELIKYMSKLLGLSKSDVVLDKV